MDYQPDYERLVERLEQRNVDVEDVKAKLKSQHIETPSWGYGNSGTRFQTFPWPGAARNIFEKVADAGYIHKLTGVAPSIAIHIPWDKTDDWDALTDFTEDQGISIGAVNPNLFQEQQHKLGSITNPSPGVREEAIAHMVECIDIMQKVDSDLLSLWFADGTNYAGQDDIVERKHRMEDSLKEVYKHLPEDARLLLEYKFFEPAFYHTDLPDWGTSYATVLKLGEQAQVLVDTGHHGHGTNIAHIVAFLLDEERLGGFHLNARRYADDDLIVGSHNPLHIFEIFAELVKAGDKARGVAYMLDQSHYIIDKLEATLISVLNCQTAYAKALIVDYPTLREKQQAGDVLGGHRVMMEAYNTDVFPLLAKAREEMGREPDPLAVYESDNYKDRVKEERGVAAPGAGGYPG